MKLPVRVLGFAFACFLASSLSAEGREHIIKVEYPVDKTVMKFGLINISLSLPHGMADLIEIRVNNKTRASRVPGREIECFSVPLALGINKINLIAKKKGLIVDRVSLDVFRRSDLIGKYATPPAGFQKDYFHQEDRPRCAGCHHRLEPTKVDEKPINIDTFADEISKYNANVSSESTCYSCHRRMTAYRFVHGPDFVWSCLSCHDPEATPRYFIKYPDPELCYKCHFREKQIRSTKKYYHTPFTTGRCGICHNPHASENPLSLVKPIWDLCRSCHTDKGSGRHVVAGYLMGDKHPTRGVPDPRRKEQELSCASCHDPHASDSRKFSTLNPERGFDFCRKCHFPIERKLKFPVQSP